jgi:hypothetical protein
MAIVAERKGGSVRSAEDFYRDALRTLLEAELPFLVGGGLALAQYTSVVRETKDLDVFLRPEHAQPALDALARAGYRTEMTFPHWLGKAHHEGSYVDVIFSSGNGVALVDDEWFEHARTAHVLGLEVQICPPEEVLWSKAFILERERFDGADVNHLLRDCGPDLDWERLLRRFAGHWRVLLAHMVLFGYVYPGERHRVPGRIMDELVNRLATEQKSAPPDVRVCQGTLLSREQYLLDVEELGYEDPRITDPAVHMTSEDVVTWTRAIADREAKPEPPASRPSQPTRPSPPRKGSRARAETGHKRRRRG